MTHQFVDTALNSSSNSKLYSQFRTIESILSFTEVFFSYSLSVSCPKESTHPLTRTLAPLFSHLVDLVASFLPSSHVTVGSLLLLLLRVAERRLLLELPGLRGSTASAAASAPSSTRTSTAPHWASAADRRASPTPDRTFSSQYTECTRRSAYRIHGQFYTCPNSCPI